MGLLSTVRTLLNTASEHLADHLQIHKKLNAVIDVKADFGAVGDGVQDDGVKWNDARAALPADGGLVFVPPGTYALTTAFTFAAQANVTLWISPGVTLSGAALPAATGTNAIIDCRGGKFKLQGGGALESQPGSQTGTSLKAMTDTGSVVLKHVPDSADRQNVFNLYPPADDRRSKLSFWSKPDGAAGNKRPLSIEIHGTADQYSPENHVTFYVENDVGAYEHVMEWLWGSSWNNYCRMWTGLRIDEEVAIGNTPPASTVKLMVMQGVNSQTLLALRPQATSPGNLIRMEDSAGALVAFFDQNAVLKRFAATSGVQWFNMAVTGDTAGRFQADVAGRVDWGPGNTAVDTRLERKAVSVLGVGADDCFRTGVNITANRPLASAVGAGSQFYDTLLSKPIWSDGTVWRDANGTIV